MPIDLAAAVDVVRPLVIEQGELVLRRWPQAAPMLHKDRRDFATSVDLEVERHLKAGLQQRFPGHGVSGEETGDEDSDADYQWLIDPIDGTKYYAAQSSLYAVSVGLLHRGEPVLGIVYSPTSKQCFTAWSGGGAFVGDQRLEGPRAKALGDVILDVDTPGSDTLSPEEREWFERKLVALTRGVYRVRALGIGSLAACWLASGALDAYVDLTGYTKPQDLAAGRVIMREAGARVDAINPGVGPRRLLAAPPEVWEALRDVLCS